MKSSNTKEKFNDWRSSYDIGVDIYPGDDSTVPTPNRYEKQIKMRLATTHDMFIMIKRRNTRSLVKIGVQIIKDITKKANNTPFLR
ncbi:hypothetical protein VCR3J2_40126 [Vibrio coralliirubri]|nr:hypothetical protein VCR3J2_40126 [Vibrio coralliirubri]